MAPDARLTTAANDLLDNLTAALTTAGINVPTRSYVHAGQIAHDFAGANCADAFIVAWDLNAQGQVSVPAVPGFIKCSMPLAAQFTIALLRCVPVFKTGAGGKPLAPTEGELQASGEQIMDDAMTLCATIVDLAAARTLLSAGESNTIGIGSVAAYGPQGGVGGTIVTLFATLLQ